MSKTVTTRLDDDPLTLFEKNRNDLSKFCYDLSKAILISMIAVPIFKKELDLLSIVVGSLVSALFLFLGMILKGENRKC